MKLYIDKREYEGGFFPAYIMGAFLLAGFLGTLANWNPLQMNWVAYIFIAVWHALLFYWLWNFVRKEQYFSHSTVTIEHGEILVDRSFVKVGTGSETTPIRDVGLVTVHEGENFLGMLLNNSDLRFVDFATSAQAEMMVNEIVKHNSDVQVVGPLEPDDRTRQSLKAFRLPRGLKLDDFGVIVVDHGSLAQASNEMLLRIAEDFQRVSGLPIVEPAHMELAEPTIGTALRRCIDQGAKLVVVFPYFLLPGRHSQEDIPRLAAEAAANHPGVCVLVAEPFGRQPEMLDAMQARILQCLNAAAPVGE